MVPAAKRRLTDGGEANSQPQAGTVTLNRSATNVPNACRIANIALNDATILPYGGNPGRMEFSERTTTRSARYIIWISPDVLPQKRLSGKLRRSLAP
jgi:hypothetical protein